MPPLDPASRPEFEPKRSAPARARLTATLMAAAVLIGLGSSPGRAENPDGWLGRTVISDVPWDPAPLKEEAAAPQPKLVYGADDRIDVYQEVDPLRLQLAASTCALVNVSQLSSNGSGGFNLQTGAYRISGLPACSGEPFANQPTAAFCTGFLVAPDIIVTAGHCYDENDISTVRFVFGFQMQSSSSPVTSFAANQVYSGVHVISQSLDSTTQLDYSVIRLDRPVTAPGATVLGIRRSGTIPAGTQIGVIGHPSGLPEKIAFGSDTQVYNTDNPVYFVANLDTYAGNSGSPVFNAATGVVEGILVRGQTDFTFTSTCFSSKVLSNSQAGEEVTKAPQWAQFVPETPSQTGTLSLGGSVFNCGEPLNAAVADGGLLGAGSVNVSFSTTGGDHETLSLTEAPAGTGYFSASVPTVIGSPVANNGKIEVQHNNTVTASYADANTGSGNPGVVTASTVADCVRGDYFTEYFSTGMDLDNTTLVFTPDGTENGYAMCRRSASTYPTDPTGGVELSALADDGTSQVALTGGAHVVYFGQNYSSFFINANGFITFGAGVSDYSPSTQGHFSRIQISAAFHDFDPSAGGLVSYKQLSDRIAATWDGVPSWNTTNVNRFQVELFFDGRLTITHLNMDADSGVVGLSRGGGQAIDFLNSNLSSYPSCSVADSSSILSESIPDLLFPNQTVQAMVTVQNTGAATWTSAGGYGLLAASDTCGLAQPGLIAVPADVSVAPGQSHAFHVTLRTSASTAGYCGIYWVMTRGGANFGASLTTEFNVGPEFDYDFSAAAAGWFGGVAAGGGSAFLEQGDGMCVSTPTTGDNVSGWVSPDAYIPLVDLNVVRVQITASTDQAAVDRIPAWDLSYDNVTSTGSGPAYGGELIVLDTAGGANGVGRAQGRTGFEIWAAPNAALTPQWRGTLATGTPGENANSAFTPAADALNDTRLVYRTLDLDSGGFAADVDSGKLCVRSLRATRHAIPALRALDTLYQGALTNAAQAPQTAAQAAEGAGTAQIFDGGAALYQLMASGPGSRKTLFPFIAALFDPANPAAYAPLYPIGWSGNALYLGTVYIASYVGNGAGPEGSDPLDAVIVDMDAATSELVNLHFTLRGAPGYFAGAASPRLGATAGGVQPYIGFFYGHNATAVNLSILPNANRLRIQGDFFNTAEIAPQGSGADPFIVTSMRVDVVAP